MSDHGPDSHRHNRYLGGSTRRNVHRCHSSHDALKHFIIFTALHQRTTVQPNEKGFNTILHPLLIHSVQLGKCERYLVVAESQSDSRDAKNFAFEERCMDIFFQRNCDPPLLLVLATRVHSTVTVHINATRSRPWALSEQFGVEIWFNRFEGASSTLGRHVVLKITVDEESGGDLMHEAEVYAKLSGVGPRATVFSKTVWGQRLCSSITLDSASRVLNLYIFYPSVELVRRKELLDKVADLHQGGICHNDLEPRNILVDDDGHVNIADFHIMSSDHICEGHHSCDELVGFHRIRR
ncbi:hypothetical protein DFH09DRAFT_1068848 [Mycena vulgaris]|nr:hypothetical protein DFH09DRAFT_1068848 [Mycena vulgaris]